MRPQLAIIDWGIGGISICKLVKSQLGNIPILYFSDTGVTPYGKMSRSELVTRLNKVIAFLKSLGASHLVIGCNAASTVIPLLNVGGMAVEGVIDCAIRLTTRMRPKRLGLLGGKRTIVSGIYRRKFAERGIKVTQRIAQPISALIEAGDVSSNHLREECRRVLFPVRNCSHLLLACTHYPAIIPIIKEFVSDNTVIIDPVSEVIMTIRRWNLMGSGKDVYFTSGEPEAMRNAARNAFDYDITKAKQVVV